MEQTAVQPELVSFCGLYCANCSKLKKGKCPGCAKNEKATWCKIRSCCMEKNINSCAECNEFENPKDCKKFNNFVSRLFEFVFRSDRQASIELIKAQGREGFALQMQQRDAMVVKK